MIWISRNSYRFLVEFTRTMIYVTDQRMSGGHADDQMANQMISGSFPSI